MQSRLIRKKFIEYFLSKKHVQIPTSSVVPENDPTVLFTTAGMQQLVPYLLGKEHPLGNRLFSIQKCVRTGDIDDVGDERHLTLFEMMGNWSLGDYFKKESIQMSYEFLTKELGLSHEKLSATVFEGYGEVPLDEESRVAWRDLGMSDDNIIPLPPKNNWWPDYGAKGPCGPDTEIHYDTGAECSGDECYPGGENARYLEIWNNVFMEFECDGNGTFKKLAKQNVDTGMGLERMAMILQGATTVFETDLFVSLIKKVEEVTGVKYAAFSKKESEINEAEKATLKAIRIIVDHIRAASFIIADGVSPSNEGRGYVLRRIMRRAIYNIKNLKEDAASHLKALAEIVVAEYAEFYPELEARKNIIYSTIDLEVTKFLETLQKGEKILAGYIDIAVANRSNVLNGADAFKLYDTFGFPISLTQEIAKKSNVEVDMDSYASELEAQQERSRSGSKDMFKRGRESVQTELTGLPQTSTHFFEYEEGAHLPRMERDSTILAAYPLENDEVALVLENTVFYAESGGQVGDTGIISGEDFRVQIKDTQKYDGVVVHFGLLTGAVSSLDLKGKKVHLLVDAARRMRIMASHTGAHLLHKALRDVLGDSVEQAGSYVDEFRTRFDFSFPRALTASELQSIEAKVNAAIAAWYPVVKSEMTYAEAKANGAIGLFTEKYGSTVRVVAVGGEYSVELCGGTHVSNTSEIGIAKIVKETSIASGVRRIEMITGLGVYEHLLGLQSTVESLMDEVKAPKVEDLLDKIRGQKNTIKDQEASLKEFSKKLAASSLDSLLSQIKEKDGVSTIVAVLEVATLNEVKEISSLLRSSQRADIGLLVSQNGDFIVFSDNSSISARDLWEKVQPVLGGKGGGNAGMVQGVGVAVEKVGDVTLS